MLAARIVTGTVLFVACVTAMFLLPPAAWSVLVLLVVVAGGREWAALAGWSRSGQVAYCGGLVALAAALYAGAAREAGWLEPGVYAAACLFWLVFVPARLAGIGMARGPAAAAIVGLVVLLPAWLAVSRLQAEPVWLLSLLAIVWLADSAAYFAGRSWGRTRLAPSISPGKTWEGVAGAAVAVSVYYVALSAFAVVPEWSGTLRGVLLFAGVTVLSIVGDLFESWVKRRAGVKDSGGLLPGHGGVLDRIDGLVAAMPFAALVTRFPG